MSYSFIEAKIKFPLHNPDQVKKYKGIKRIVLFTISVILFISLSWCSTQADVGAWVEPSMQPLQQVEAQVQTVNEELKQVHLQPDPPSYQKTSASPVNTPPPPAPKPAPTYNAATVTQNDASDFGYDDFEDVVDDYLEYEDSNAGGCCKVCSKGKACWDSCISRDYTCHKGPGCACDG